MSLTVVNSATATFAAAQNVTVNKPTNTAQNDLMVALIGGNGSTGSYSAPTGWTAGANAVTTDTTQQLQWWWKLAGASEGTSYVFTATTTPNWGGGAGIISLRGAHLTTPILATSAISQAYFSDVNIPMNSVTFSSADVCSLFLISFQSTNGTFVYPSGWTQQFAAFDGYNAGLLAINLTDATVTSLAAQTVTSPAVEYSDSLQVAIQLAATSTTVPPGFFASQGIGWGGF